MTYLILWEDSEGDTNSAKRATLEAAKNHIKALAEDGGNGDFRLYEVARELSLRIGVSVQVDVEVGA